MTRNLLFELTEDLSRSLYNTGKRTLKQLSPKARGEAARLARCQDIAEARLMDLSHGTEPPQVTGPVLIDGIWYNANHWFRLAILRRALGLAEQDEIGVTGEYLAGRSRRTMSRLGVGKTVSAVDYQKAAVIDRAAIQQVMDQIAVPDDILAVRWPEDLPAHFVYDYFLKRQRNGVVNVTDPKLPTYVREVFKAAAGARALLDDQRFALVVLSEVGTFTQLAIAWLCIKRSVPAICLKGVRGCLRLTRLTELDDLYRITNAPRWADVTDLLPDQMDHIRSQGRAYLERRYRGNVSDPGARESFRANTGTASRQSICDTFDWPSERPIIALYSANWYDRPHAFGMSHFRDFVDFTDAVVEVVRRTPTVSWLLKEHPSNKLYGGFSLRDRIGEQNLPHIRIADPAWNGLDLLNSMDGAVTYHGTVGIEAAGMGIPALVPDQGYYDEFGFVRRAASREDFLAILGTPWWRDADRDDMRRRAELFAGIHYVMPEWQRDFEYPNDFTQDEAFALIPGMLDDYSDVIDLECTWIQRWFTSESRTYHVFKVLNDLDNPAIRATGNNQMPNDPRQHTINL